MRYISFIAMAATMLVGSSAFANNDSFEFRCRLDSAKGKGGHCYVKGELCKEYGGGVRGCRDVERGDWRAKLAVKCTDGFRLWDHDAELDKDNGDLIIAGEKHDNEAVLTVEDFFDYDRGEKEFDATLVTSEDGDEATWAGECEFRRSRPIVE